MHAWFDILKNANTEKKLNKTTKKKLQNYKKKLQKN